MNTSKKDCKFCDKKGLFILPLRYSVVVTDAASASLPALPPTLGSNVSDIPLSGAKYAPRLLREGFLYVLIKRAALQYWEAYVVTEDAFLYKFPVEAPPQLAVEFSCDEGVCGIDASMVAIDKAELVEKVYFLFTPNFMTLRKLDEYKKNPDGMVSSGQMQVFRPKDWIAGNTNQQHSMKPEQLYTHVPEFSLYRQYGQALKSDFGKGMEGQLFPAIKGAYAGAPPLVENTAPPGRLGALEFKMKKNKAAAFAIFDHIGLTQELNDFRNDAFMAVDGFMAKTDNSIGNTYRFDVYAAIGQLRSAMEKGVITDAQNSVELADMKRRAMRGAEPIFSDDSVQMRRFKMQANNAYTYPLRKEWEAKNSDKVAQFLEARDIDEQRIMDATAERTEKMWQSKYAPAVDVDEMKEFNDSLNQLGAAARSLADTRAPQHMSWLQSDRVLKAFDVYDSKCAGSGEALLAHVVGCIFGMEGSPKAEAILTEWATATCIKRENLLLRAFTRDQDAAKKAADKTLAEVTALVAGMSDMSALPNTSWQKATKGLVSAVKSTDSALDEWMRNQGQSKSYLNPKHIANAEARFFYLISTVTRSVARKGMGGKLEMSVLARANALMNGFLGDLASEIEFKTSSLIIDQQKWSDLKEKHASADKLAQASSSRKSSQERRAFQQAKKVKAALQIAALELVTDAQLKAKLQIANGAKNLGWGELQKQLQASAAQHTGYEKAAKALKDELLVRNRIPTEPSPTNNYHQVRLGGALAGIELIALLGKLSEIKKDNWSLLWPELMASVLSLTSISLDMMYALTKSVRELPQYSTFSGVKLGADIVRGGFKMTAGLFAVAAGTTMAILDWKRLEKETDPIQHVILLSRAVTGGASAIGGAFAAYSYSGPLLQHLAEKNGRSLIASRAYGWAARGAFSLSSRVLLLRTIAWLGWIGVAITVADISYAGYRWYIDATAVERWLGRCVFRRNKSNKPYADKEEELKEFSKAKSPGQENKMSPAGS